MNGGTKPEPKPLRWEAGFRQNRMMEGGMAGCFIRFDAGQVQAAVEYLRQQIMKKIKDPESRKAALDAVGEAFQEF